MALNVKHINHIYNKIIILFFVFFYVDYICILNGMMSAYCGCWLRHVVKERV